MTSAILTRSFFLVKIDLGGSLRIRCSSRPIGFTPPLSFLKYYEWQKHPPFEDSFGKFVLCVGDGA